MKAVSRWVSNPGMTRVTKILLNNGYYTELFISWLASEFCDKSGVTNDSVATVVVIAVEEVAMPSGTETSCSTSSIMASAFSLRRS